MTVYLTAQGVQHFSITIASGSTTGTASINAVGSGAFILNGGINPSTAPNPSQIFAYLTLTNSTTITATRANGSIGSVVITGCIVDGDTTTLIKSVQYGVITIANTTASGTASISSVTNANTATHLLGWNSANKSGNWLNENPVISLSGTTVTAARQGTTGNLIVGFVVIEFQGSALNQNVQNISATGTSSASTYTQSITSVDPNNTLCMYAGCQASLNTTAAEYSNFRGELTSATVFSVTADGLFVGAAQIYNCSIIELSAGVLSVNAQRGTTAISTGTSNTSAISASPLAKSALSWLGQSTHVNTFATNSALGMAALTNATTITETRNSSTSNLTGSWEVASFTTTSVAPSGDCIWFGMTV